MLKQVEAVVKFVKEVFVENKIEFNEGDVAKSILTSKMKEEIRSKLFAGFRAGEIMLSAEFTDPELKKYVSGLLDNHLRKCKELNGGTKYEIKAPGSRTNNSDAMIRELNKTLQVVTDPEKRSMIEQAIADRKSELAKAKASKVEINVELLPAHLRELVNQ